MQEPANLSVPFVFGSTSPAPSLNINPFLSYFGKDSTNLNTTASTPDIKSFNASAAAFQVVMEKCAICQLRFESAGDLVPHELICGHSFCYKDLKLLTAIKDNKSLNSMHCPSCSRSIQLTHYTAGFPPKNNVILSYLAAVAELESKLSSPLACLNCEDKSSAVYCVQCDVELCESCDRNIHSLKVFAKHSRGALDTKPIHYLICKTHQEQMKIYCSCNMPVCALCISHGAHKGHDSKLLTDAVEEGKTLLTTTLAKQNEMMSSLNDCSKRLTTAKAQLSKNETKCVQEIRSCMEVARKALNNKERDLIQKINVLTSTQQMDISTRMQAIAASNTALTKANLDAALALGIVDVKLVEKIEVSQKQLDISITNATNIVASNTTIPSGNIDCKFNLNIDSAISKMHVFIKMAECRWEGVPFDENGVLYYIGTNGKSTSYKNPHDAGYVVSQWSSIGLGSSSVAAFVERNNQGEFCATSNVSNSWMSVDLGEKMRLVVNHFCIRDNWNCRSKLRNWELQSSEDGQTWSVLLVQNSTAFHTSSSVPTNWPVVELKQNGARFFRILQTGPNSNMNQELVCGGIELYGTLYL